MTIGLAYEMWKWLEEFLFGSRRRDAWLGIQIIKVQVGYEILQFSILIAFMKENGMDIFDTIFSSFQILASYTIAWDEMLPKLGKETFIVFEVPRFQETLRHFSSIQSKEFVDNFYKKILKMCKIVPSNEIWTFLWQRNTNLKCNQFE